MHTICDVYYVHMVCVCDIIFCHLSYIADQFVVGVAWYLSLLLVIA